MNIKLIKINNKILTLLALILLQLNLTACGPLIVASAVGTFSVIADRRTTGTIIEDNAIELKAFKKFNEDELISDNSKISVTSYNERILLTGQAKNQDIKEHIVDTIRSISKVRTIYDEIVVSENESFSSSSYDTWLTTKIKTALAGNSGVNPLNVKVTTDNKTAYLMGLVTKEEAQIATDIARNINGVNKVVKLFEYIEPDNTSNTQYAMN